MNKKAKQSIIQFVKDKLDKEKQIDCEQIISGFKSIGLTNAFKNFQSHGDL